MIGLVRAEIRRLTSRRLYSVVVVLFAGVIVLVGAFVFWRTARVDGNVDYATVVPLGIRIAAQLLFSLSVVVGASFVGAEWSSGAMTTFLTWEVRRGRVLAAKLCAAAVTLAGTTLVLMVLLALVLLPSGIAHGTMSGLTGAWWGSTAGLWLRAGALSAMGAGLGVGLAGLMRNSAGPIATWLVFEFLVAQLLVVWRPGLFRWMPGANIQQFLYSDEIFGATVNGQELLGSFSALRAGLVLAAYTAALLGASYASFRRDVT